MGGWKREVRVSWIAVGELDGQAMRWGIVSSLALLSAAGIAIHLYRSRRRASAGAMYLAMNAVLTFGVLAVQRDNFLGFSLLLTPQLVAISAIVLARRGRLVRLSSIGAVLLILQGVLWSTTVEAGWFNLNESRRLGRPALQSDIEAWAAANEGVVDQATALRGTRATVHLMTRDEMVSASAYGLVSRDKGLEHGWLEAPGWQEEATLAGWIEANRSSSALVANVDSSWDGPFVPEDLAAEAIRSVLAENGCALEATVRIPDGRRVEFRSC